MTAGPTTPEKMMVVKTVDAEGINFTYAATLDAMFTEGTMKVNLAYIKGKEIHLSPASGATEPDRFASAVNAAISTEFIETSPARGWLVNGVDTDTSYSYGIEKFITDDPDEESEVTEAYDDELPYDRDTDRPFSLYRFTNKDTGVSIYCYVHAVSREYHEVLGEWQVFTNVEEGED